MPDIVSVSDSLERLNAKTRLAADTVTITDGVTILVAKQVSKSLTQTVAITEQAVITQRTKTRLISQTTTIAEQLKAYKNDVELVPVAAPAEIPTPQNIIGTRQFKARAVPRAPRAIIIDEISNVAIAPLKLLAFSDSNNKAITGIKPRPTPNVALSTIILARSPMSLAQSSIKTQLQPMELKTQLRLPLSSLNLTTAKLKLRPQSQSIHALKAVNFDKIYKLTRIMKIAMLAEKL